METFPLLETLSRHSLAVLALAQPPSGGGSCNGGSGTGNNVALTGGGAITYAVTLGRRQNKKNNSARKVYAHMYVGSGSCGVVQQQMSSFRRCF